MTRLLPLVGHTGRLTSRLLALVLVGQAIVLVFFAFLARGYAVADGREADGTRLLWVGLGLAALAVLGSGLCRGPFGVTVGWLVQVATWAAVVVAPSMAVVALIFTGLWVLLMVKGRQADETYDRRRAEASEGAAGAGH